MKTSSVVKGMVWYPAARVAVGLFAEKHHLSFSEAAAIVAIMSQRQRWEKTLALAEAALLGHPVGFKAQRRKILAIVGGADPEQVVKGDKIRAFWKALCGDDTQAVIDVWMLRALKEKNTKPHTALYMRLTKRLQTRAKRTGLSVTTYQAALWVETRETWNGKA